MKNPAVDAYIAKSAGFAKPILTHVRKLMHKGCPTIDETIKWGVPAFERDGIVAMMAAFKQHVAFGFWSERLIREKLGADAKRMFPKDAKLGMGGRRYHGARGAARGRGHPPCGQGGGRAQRGGRPAEARAPEEAAGQGAAVPRSPR